MKKSSTYILKKNISKIPPEINEQSMRRPQPQTKHRHLHYTKTQNKNRNSKRKTEKINLKPIPM